MTRYEHGRVTGELDVMGGAELIDLERATAQRVNLNLPTIQRDEGDTVTLDMSKVTPETRQWLLNNDVSLEALADMSRIREHYGNEYRLLMDFVRYRSRRRILRCLIEHPLGVGYETLSDRADISNRKVRKHVKKLADWGIVTKSGNPVCVQWANDEHRYLAVEVDANY